LQPLARKLKREVKNEMKKLAIAFSFVTALAACNSNGTISEEKLNVAGEKLQKTVEKTADTIVSKVDKWADSLTSHPDTIIVKH
jgi:hypothetical protein